jgi:hypothetical protein
VGVIVAIIAGFASVPFTAAFSLLLMALIFMVVVFITAVPFLLLVTVFDAKCRMHALASLASGVCPSCDSHETVVHQPGEGMICYRCDGRFLRDGFVARRRHVVIKRGDPNSSPKSPSLEAGSANVPQPDRTKQWVAFEFDYESEDYELDPPMDILRKWVVDEVNRGDEDGLCVVVVEHDEEETKVELIDGLLKPAVIRSRVFEAVTSDSYLAIMNVIPWRFLESGTSMTAKGVIDLDDYARSSVHCRRKLIPDLSDFASDIWSITTVGHDALYAAILVRSDQLRHLDAKAFHMVQPYIKK